MRKSSFFFLAASVLMVGCVRVPTGPDMMVLPGNGTSFEQFQYDDALCRQWASQQCGATSKHPTDTVATGAAVGTVLGAASGAAIGAAAGDPAMGAAVGSGVGLLGGTAAGADAAAVEQSTLQRRYDIAYMQCMYARGNQIPIPGGVQRPRNSGGTHPAPRVDVPPPPVGSPPPPPPGASPY